ncbi:MAG: hypothetical protein ACREJC_13195, partial [Tepidisphaeraceae bacterium]
MLTRPCAAILALMLVSSGWDASATEPPSTAPSDRIKTLFAELADPNPQIREAARVDLLGID